MAISSPEQLASERLLTDAEVARVLRVSIESVQYLHRTKRLCGVKVTEKNLRWRLRDVDRFVDSLSAD